MCSSTLLGTSLNRKVLNFKSVTITNVCDFCQITNSEISKMICLSLRIFFSLLPGIWFNFDRLKVGLNLIYLMSYFKCYMQKIFPPEERTKSQGVVKYVYSQPKAQPNSFMTEVGQHFWKWYLKHKQKILWSLFCRLSATKPCRLWCEWCGSVFFFTNFRRGIENTFPSSNSW